MGPLPVLVFFLRNPTLTRFAQISDISSLMITWPSLNRLTLEALVEAATVACNWFDLSNRDTRDITSLSAQMWYLKSYSQQTSNRKYRIVISSPAHSSSRSTMAELRSKTGKLMRSHSKNDVFSPGLQGLETLKTLLWWLWLIGRTLRFTCAPSKWHGQRYWGSQWCNEE